MKKTYCDRCETEIESHEHYVLTFMRHGADDKIIAAGSRFEEDMDLCGSCAKMIKDVFTSTMLAEPAPRKP